MGESSSGTNSTSTGADAHVQRLRRRRRILLAAIGLLVVAVIVAALLPTLLQRSHRNAGATGALKEAAFSIQSGIQRWAKRHNGLYPRASQVNAVDLQVDSWPLNPYLEEPMTQGKGPGFFAYRLGPSRRSFTLILYDEDGIAVTTKSGP